MLLINAAVIIFIFVMNFFYQSNGFDFTLKCVCSISFAVLGLINLYYAFATKQKNVSFYVGMAAGLVLAMLGDILIKVDFIIGAAVFAAGHIFFIAAYCLFSRLCLKDVIFSGILFAGGASFLLFCPLLNFSVPVFRVICVVYALIISVMLGKAIGNFIKSRNLFTGTVAFAALLFFISDLMLVFDRFIGLWDWTGHVCM